MFNPDLNQKAESFSLNYCLHFAVCGLSDFFSQKKSDSHLQIKSNIAFGWARDTLGRPTAIHSFARFNMFIQIKSFTFFMILEADNTFAFPS